MARIHDYQDRRASDSLFQFLIHNNARYREKAALAFASIQDTAAAERLGALLMDPTPAVRSATAYALGQTGGAKAASLLLNALATERDNDVRDFILEAIGKTVDVDEIPETKIKSPGIPWMYYRLGLRHETPPGINKIAARYLSKKSDRMSRLGAAHFFARSKTSEIDNVFDALANALRNDPDPEVRMAIARALRKVVSKTSLDVLTIAALNDSDYRVRVNAVNALESFPFEETRTTLFRACQDPTLQVAVAAAGTVGKFTDESNAEEIAAIARNAKHWRVQAMLFQAANTSDKLNDEIEALYNDAFNPYQKAALLMALNGRDALKFASDVLFTTKIPAIRTAAAQVIVALNGEFSENIEDRRMFLDLYSRGIALGDLAVTGLFTGALADDDLGFKDVVTDLKFLYDARDKFTLPRDYESYVPLEKAIAYFEDREPAAVDRPFNHPIDWDLVRRIPSHQQAVLTTTKGEILIDLHVDVAPGSVANFVQLAQDRYYDGKSFHRVVPNFVVQGGCDRGDGWGSADYSIRSEFGHIRYGTGSVGLASAGKDTESTQFFITHSPTPHLDGRYTIFGTVTKGMENAHRLEVGDSILSVKLVPPLNPG
jgi:cyclophilin family peptidyl-prolyl cis-trans isomerase/HEAT repeat protein